MKRIIMLILSLLLIIVSMNHVMAANTKDVVPIKVVNYVQDVLFERVTRLIETSFTSSEPDTYRFKNAKKGDTYHLSSGRRFYAITDTISLTKNANLSIANIISPTDGWIFTANNSFNEPVVLVEVFCNEDGSFGYIYGDDAYLFDKCLCLMSSLLKSDGITEEPIIINDNTFALFVKDTAGVERIMPIPSIEEQAKEVLDVTSLAQLPTGEELFKALQNRKREADSSPEILYGGSVFQELMIHPADNETRIGYDSPLHLTVYIAIFAAVATAAVAITINALYRRRKSFFRDS